MYPEPTGLRAPNTQRQIIIVTEDRTGVEQSWLNAECLCCIFKKQPFTSLGAIVKIIIILD